jgi:hypothetical protein
LLVLLALADFADDEGLCFPRISTIAKKARLSERSVQDALCKLEAIGEIRRELGGGRKVTRYYIFEGCKICTGAAHRTSEVRPTAPPIYIEPSIEPSIVSPPALKGKKLHPPNPLFDALVKYGERLDPAKFPPGTGGKIGKALADIKRYTPILTIEEIKRRADNYCAHFGEKYLTATALASHWVKCDAPPHEEQGGIRCVNS